jgi:hypothetical protein
MHACGPKGHEFYTGHDRFQDFLYIMHTKPAPCGCPSKMCCHGWSDPEIMANVAKYQWYNNKSWPYAVECYLSRELDPHRLPAPMREWLRHLLMIIHRELQNLIISHLIVFLLVLLHG